MYRIRISRKWSIFLHTKQIKFTLYFKQRSFRSQKWENANCKPQCQCSINKKLSYRRETARCFMSSNISLSRSRLLKIIENGTIRKLGYGFLFVSIVTMALSCIISEKKRDIGRKSLFFIHHTFDAHVRLASHRDAAITFGTEKLEWLQDGEKVWGFI